MNDRAGWMKYGFVGPTLVLLVLFNVFPLFYNIVLSFSDVDLSGGTWSWIGVRNYGTVFTRAEYGAAIRTTALFVGVAVAVELLLGFLLALSLKEWFPGKTAVLTILLVPMMLSPAVMGLYWNLLLNGHYGLVNQILGAFGVPLDRQPQWLTDTNLKLSAILLIDVWMWTPFMMLIALAGLNAIPKSIYEAAEIDRAGAWTVFRRITLPMCAPLLVLAVLLRTTDALKQFDLVMAITGPNDAATQTLSALLYQTAFSNSKVGLGSAYACVTLVMVIALASVFTRYIGYIQRRQGRAEP
ncbi:MAG: sugar ABC transporter permease [Kiritimatiellae bacterium]|nr:sugar ABC transporter permease [Kiritimatiellia bacterium]